MSKPILCPICGEGHLSPKISVRPFEYKGQVKSLPVHYCECSFCGTDQASESELSFNKRTMNEFKKEVDGLLTGKEITELRRHWKLTQSDAAKIFGGGPVAFSKYESETVTQSVSMDKLLRVSMAIPQVIEYLADLAGVALSIKIKDKVVFNEDSKPHWIYIDKYQRSRSGSIRIHARKDDENTAHTRIVNNHAEIARVVNLSVKNLRFRTETV
ncbi:type II toxin-antitoxin system MqsA family antitoxin [Serratia plymuthica]|uniref:type II toxin-antitoxin system MqsA family antitoxin n=1 Tax=Serratia plymuthica TaxID=82996 RepID=UPI003DA1CD12